ncbi:exodeoxyribonuclease 7 large subunit [Alphaproteobacteria bacterium]|nr:exodeoxyribonuclease 7 large subunit [Alphaproteobacteria bacterium]GHS96569.1 exodeoxyribonuclease 7 large subunit [Alphaproteobacteria bacterium]
MPSFPVFWGLEEFESLPEEPFVFSVAALSKRIKQCIEESFSNVRVHAEIVGLKKHSSGHLYFSLKDSDEEIFLNAICWRGTHTSVALEEGMEIIATGRITTYPGRSNYQIIVTEAEMAGQGALLKLFEERKRKLAEEGVFAKKLPLPKFPQKIGVVTSETGAVIQDILHRISDRYPCSVVLWPVAVQGNTAAAQVSQAIDGFNALPVEQRPNVLIVARGGGSLEDLWPFNEEIVARAAFHSRIPLISAIGHETDTTLIDYAADMRAPTPTAAAELATPLRSQILLQVETWKKQLVQALLRISEIMHMRVQNCHIPKLEYILQPYVMRLDDASERWAQSFQKAILAKERGLLVSQARLAPPKNLLTEAGLKLDAIQKQILLLLQRQLQTLQNRLDMSAQNLAQNSYAAILKRGFCLVTDDAGKGLKSAQDVPETPLLLHFHDGTVPVVKT